jgi:hypothetical protein
MSFPRHREIYRPMWSFRARSLGATTAAAPIHRLDEFPAGYSLAGCAPAEPASASPAGNQYALQSFCRSRIFQRTANSVLTVCVSSGGKRRKRSESRDATVNMVLCFIGKSPYWILCVPHCPAAFAYSVQLISSGVVEGLNNKAMVTMRKSCGFRTKLPEPESTHDFF